MKFYIPKNAESENLNKHWQVGIGSGHASLALRVDYIKHLKFIHDELGIESVRFHGIFDDDMHTMDSMESIMPIPGTEKFTERSFRMCGLVYDNILSCGMKPFVELGFMPKALAKNDTKGAFYYKPNISMPKNEKVWKNYIQDFVKFLIKRYSKEEVESWFFEVWNEPDLGPIFFDGNMDDYFKLYEITVKAIKEIDEKIKVGGPSTSGSKWIKEFKGYCEKNNVPVDFITTHQYAGDPLGGVNEESENEFDTEAISNLLKKSKPGSILDGYRIFTEDKSETRELRNDVFKINSGIVKEQAGNIPVYYTEWNASAIFSAYTNDTKKVAAYIVKAALDVSNNIAGSCVWCFSDIFEEHHPFPEEFHGGYGILTQNGIPKPSFYAMKMLSEIGDKRILLEENEDKEIELAAFKDNNSMQLLLYRQKMKNLNLPLKNAEITIETENRPQKIIIKKIDDIYGNPLKIWEEKDSPIDMTPKEITEIIEKSNLVEKKIDYEFKEGKIIFNTKLGVNDVHLIKIVD